MPPLLRILVIAVALGLVSAAVVYASIRFRELQHEKEMKQLEHEQELEEREFDELFGPGGEMEDDIEAELERGRR